MEAAGGFSTEEMIGLWRGFWKGGYHEGDPADPFGRSSYAQMGYLSVLHAIYQVCIRPHVSADSKVLEIGPGRGAWTKTMLAAKEIWCLDVNSAEHNGFWPYVGEENRRKLRYLQVSDFSCGDLPDEHFDFLFSFGTFCHIPVEGQRLYFQNLLGKMRRGGLAAIMIGDYDKYNAAVQAYGNQSISIRRYPALLTSGRKLVDLARAVVDIGQLVTGRRPRDVLFDPMQLRSTVTIEKTPGSWVHAGVEETCRFVRSIGWTVVDPDLGLCVRDPVLLLRRPG